MSQPSPIKHEGEYHDLSTEFFADSTGRRIQTVDKHILFILIHIVIEWNKYKLSCYSYEHQLHVYDSPLHLTTFLTDLLNFVNICLRRENKLNSSSLEDVPNRQMISDVMAIKNYTVRSNNFIILILIYIWVEFLFPLDLYSSFTLLPNRVSFWVRKNDNLSCYENMRNCSKNVLQELLLKAPATDTRVINYKS